MDQMVLTVRVDLVLVLLVEEVEEVVVQVVVAVLVGQCILPLQLFL